MTFILKTQLNHRVTEITDENQDVAKGIQFTPWLMLGPLNITKNPRFVLPEKAEIQYKQGTRCQLSRA